MIIYATQKTLERFKLTTSEELPSPLKEMAIKIREIESGDGLKEWGAKILYFDRRKCMQVVNFASKLTFFLCDIKVDEVYQVPNLIFDYIYDIYSDDPEMLPLLEKYSNETQIAITEKIKDKSIISALNNTQRDFAWDGYRFYEFIENNILQTRKINKLVNFDWIISNRIDGKKDYNFAGERFKQLLKERYKNN